MQTAPKCFDPKNNAKNNAVYQRHRNATAAKTNGAFVAQGVKLTNQLLQDRPSGMVNTPMEGE